LYLVLAASEQVTVDLTVTLYQVQARVRESQYADDVYMVRVVKPEGIGDLIDEEGTLMERGKVLFRFNGRNPLNDVLIAAERLRKTTHMLLP